VANGEEGLRRQGGGRLPAGWRATSGEEGWLSAGWRPAGGEEERRRRLEADVGCFVSKREGRICIGVDLVVGGEME
jgi:hypothetical protein